MSTSTSVFTPAEIEYLQTVRLGRMATVGANGMPHVVPVTFRYNPDTDTIDIGGGYGFATRKKWRDVQKNPVLAIVVDDRIPDGKGVRGIEVRGTVEILMTGGQTIVPSLDPEMILLKPTHIASWGIDTGSYAPSQSRNV
jgi:pyridoxamine 5'-phosphate oxidase family protein